MRILSNKQTTCARFAARVGIGLILICLCLFVPKVVRAQTSEADLQRSEVVRLKAELEETIAKKYGDRIGTRVPRELFSVGAQVTLTISEETSDEKAERSDEKEGITDLSVGVLGERGAVLKKGRPGVVLPRERVVVTSVEVFVGLSPRLDTRYKEILKDWLQTNLKSEFGSRGKGTITDLAPVPKLEPTPEPGPLSLEERFGRLQNVIGLSIFAIFVILAIALFKVLPSRDNKARLEATMQIEQMKLERSAATQRREGPAAKRQKDSNETALSSNLIFDNYRDHQKKIAFIALSSVEHLEQAIELWLGEGDDGRRKLAAMLDCVLTQMGVARFSGTGAAPGPVSWQMPVRIKNEKVMAAILREFATLTIQEKNDIQERAYWDLLSVRTLGEEGVKQRFSGISQLAPQAIVKILTTQEMRARSVAVLHLPVEKLGDVASLLSYDEKKSVVEEALALNKLDEKEVESVDQSLASLAKSASADGAGWVDFAGMVPNLLMVLSPLEEVQLMREILAKRPEVIEQLRSRYPALVLMTLWTPEALKILLGGAKPAEIQALLQILPELTEKVLSVVPARMKSMLKDDLARKAMSNPDMNALLGDLRERLFVYIDEGRIDLSQAFEPSPQVRLAA